MSRVPTNRVPPGESVIDRAPGTPAADTSIRNPGGSLIFSYGRPPPRALAPPRRHPAPLGARPDPPRRLRAPVGVGGHPEVRIPVPDRADLVEDLDVESQFLPDLPRKRSRKGFAGLPLPSRKLPKTTQKTIVRTPVDQELSLPVTDHANDNVVEGKETFRRLARDAFLKALAAGLAPVRKGADRALGIPGSADDPPEGHPGGGGLPPPSP